MAKADQIVELLKSHIDGDENRFFSIAMQLAAHEARHGRMKFAEEVKELIDKARDTKSQFKKSNSVVNLIQPKGDLANLLSLDYSEITLSQLTFSPEISSKFERIIHEHKQQQSLIKHGLKPRRKILLYGPPGTGKTVTASALAGELKLPLFSIRLDGLITKYMGETASKLRVIFDAMKNTRAIYFFDEFDAIGGDRNLGNDVGEMRRILNSFLQFMEYDHSESLIIAATNNIKLLDIALFRRFDDVIEYTIPDSKQVQQIIKNRLHSFKLDIKDWNSIDKYSKGLSHAEITRACDEAAKKTILSNQKKILQKTLSDSLKERTTTQKYSS